MERWKSLPFLLRQIILATAVFLLGAGLSFAYTYRPLHGALTWKVDALESRIDERNLENSTLRDELSAMRKDTKTRVEPERLAEVESDLARTKAALKKSESKTKSVDRKRRDANGSANRWRKRYETLRDQASAMPAAPQSPASPSAAKPAKPAAAPDAPVANPPAAAAESPAMPPSQAAPTSAEPEAASDASNLP